MGLKSFFYKLLASTLSFNFSYSRDELNAIWWSYMELLMINLWLLAFMEKKVAIR